MIRPETALFGVSDQLGTWDLAHDSTREGIMRVESSYMNHGVGIHTHKNVKNTRIHRT